MPSGIDTGTCTYGGYVGFRKSEGITPLSIGLRLPIVIGDTGVPAETATTVSAVREKKQEEPVKTDELFDGIDAVSRQALEALKKEDAGELGRLMNENQRLLAQLGVSHPALERLINSSLDAGALGAKLSGKGCGGVMFALCAGEAGQKKVALAIKRAGGTPIMTQVGAEGVVRA
jgi:mevalonate kinase